MNRRDFVTKLLSIPVAAAVVAKTVDSDYAFTVKDALDDQPVPLSAFGMSGDQILTGNEEMIGYTNQLGKSVADQWDKSILEAWDKENAVGRMMKNG